jgi:hypothetical protein
VEGLARASVHTLATTSGTRLGLVDLVSSKIYEGILLSGGCDDDVATLASVAAVWTAARDAPLTQKRDRTVASLAGSEDDLYFIYKPHGMREKTRVSVSTLSG